MRVAVQSPLSADNGFGLHSKGGGIHNIVFQPGRQGRGHRCCFAIVRACIALKGNMYSWRVRQVAGVGKTVRLDRLRVIAVSNCPL
jgi:hypothetical protein